VRTLAEATLVVGLGGNQGGDDAVVARMRRAVEALPWGRVRASSVYRTAPWGGVAQAPYLNAAALVTIDEPAPTPRELIETVLEIERLLGRDRSREARWGERPIDIDVLLWGPQVIDWRGPPALAVPHPRLRERAFALVPTIELVGEDVVLPGDGRTLEDLRRSLVDQDGDQAVALTDRSLLQGAR
jgi:2-amino-4-hydroxy-6-hydroxymethyldihydropteridine diphosphokinase